MNSLSVRGLLKCNFSKDIRLVSKLLGHSDARTTEIYLDEKQELELEAEMEGKYRGGDALQKL